MQIIKQIIAQCLLLRAELKENKAVNLLAKIQSMLFALETDQLELTGKNLELTAENAVLKNKILKLEAAH